MLPRPLSREEGARFLAAGAAGKAAILTAAGAVRVPLDGGRPKPAPRLRRRYPSRRRHPVSMLIPPIEAARGHPT